jgi:hypothetical protein
MLSAVQIAADRVLLREAVLSRLDEIGPANVTAAALRAAADELPDQPVILLTQTANERSLKLAAA